MYASLNYAISPAGLILKYWRQHKSILVILAYLRLVHRVAVGLVCVVYSHVSITHASYVVKIG